MKFYEKLFELRKEKGYSQEELADKLNVARQTISKWENGTTTPDFDNLIEISKLFEISIDDLVGNNFVKESLKKEESDIEIDNQDIIKVEKSFKGKITKYKKILLRLLISVTVLCIILFLGKVVKRYKILDSIYDSMVSHSVFGLQDKRKQEFYFVKSVTEFEKNRTKNWKREDCYSKDYNFIKKYYDLEIEPHLNGGNPEVVRIEYIDGDDYYDIDVKNKTYRKGEYEPENYYDMAGSELDIAILNELSYGTIKSKILIALDFSYKINITKDNNNCEYYTLVRNGDIEKGRNLIRISAAVSEENPDITVSIRENKNGSIADWVSYDYIWEEKEVSDDSIKMPDLTGFILVDY